MIGGDSSAAEDVTQDALVRAYRALPRFRQDAKLETWFYRILVRQAQNYRRWREIRERWASQHRDPDPLVCWELEDPLLRSRVRKALAELSPAQRDVFILVRLEQFSVGEAARMLGKRENTAKTHLKRALAALRKSLGDLSHAR